MRVTGGLFEEVSSGVVRVCPHSKAFGVLWSLLWGFGLSICAWGSCTMKGIEDQVLLH